MNNVGMMRSLFLFVQLIKTELAIFRQFIIQDILNIVIWTSSFITLAIYVFPALGMTSKFGPLVAFSVIAGESYWRIWGSSFDLIADIHGNKTISYYLGLPLDSWLVLLKEIIFHAVKSLIFVFITLPIISIFLWNTYNWSSFSFFKFMIIFFGISLFNGTLFLFLASVAKQIKNIDLVGIRVVIPLWTFGSMEFPWYTIKHINTYFAYFLLANPLTYLAEGIHAATLGQQGFLPFWFCAIAVYAFSILFGWLGIKRFKTILDFV